MRHGWFIINGYQTGERTVEGQSIGLEHALAECVGKDVLDLGCAEGLIGMRFAEAGAGHVVGVEITPAKIETAQHIARERGIRNAEFIASDVWPFLEPGARARFQIVLALSIITKLADPGEMLRRAARVCSDLLILRTSAGACDGTFRAKHGGRTCNVHAILKAEGFIEERKIPGTHQEAVQYWRRS